MCAGPPSAAFAVDPDPAGLASNPPAADVRGIAQANADEPSEYLLQRGDELGVRAFNIPELEETVTVRPDGKISLVLLDDVEAAGLTTRELDALLTTRYAQFFKDPLITVIVRSMANAQVYVGGEVLQPGIVPLRGELTLTGALFRAGGFRDTAKMRNVILLRNAGRDRPAILKVDVKKVLTEGAPDLVLRPFDVVFVPQKAIARVNQFVSQYIRQLLPISTNANFTYILGERRIQVE